ncbi:MAG: protein kinase [Vicinamibacteria bacterium]|jgi:serine/threonine protein kinase|nr:protein kinase [Vicinamibacteria bacterium]
MNPTSEIPKKIGRYTIEGEIGRGVMGVVYKARDAALKRIVALKTIRLVWAFSEQQRHVFEQRFIAEARIASHLSHPGIVKAYEAGRDESTGLLYIAFEYLTGHTLAHILSEGPRPDWRATLRVASRAAAALHHAHENGVIHRDIKPANIMLLPSGEPKIMDFGIAKIDDSQLTSPGELFGTPLYMSPEQALGHPIDARADLFSLGSIVYALLTGRPAFAADNVPQILARVVHQEPPWPSELVADLPKEVDYFVARAMAKDPARRYPDGQAMSEDAQDIARGQPARHRKNWSMPEQGERTVAAGQVPHTPEGDISLTPVAEPPPPVPTARRRLHPSVSLVILFFGAAFFFFAHNPEDVGYWLRAARTIIGASTPASAEPELAPILVLPDSSPTTPMSSPDPHATQTETVEMTPPSIEPAPEPALPAVAETAWPAPIPTITPILASPASSPLPTPSPSPTTTPVTLPAPAPRATPTPAPASKPVPPETAKAAVAGARLALDFTHAVRSGRLKLTVDDALLLNEKLDSKIARRVLLVESGKGHVHPALKVAAGRRRIVLDVSVGKTTKTLRLTHTFRAGATDCLVVVYERGVFSSRWK